MEGLFDQDGLSGAQQGYARITLEVDPGEEITLAPEDGISIGQYAGSSLEYMSPRGNGQWVGTPRALHMETLPEIEGNRIKFLLQSAYVDELRDGTWEVYLLDANNQEKAHTTVGIYDIMYSPLQGNNIVTGFEEKEDIAEDQPDKADEKAMADKVDNAEVEKKAEAAVEPKRDSVDISQTMAALNALAATAQILADASVKGQEWIGNNEERVRKCGKSPDDAKAELRRQARIARKLKRAASRRMCAGVFGPSQAGKSYLLSSLARDANGKVPVVLGDRTCDFLGDLNPEGGKESTGLVTRFTLKKPESVPSGFPVHVRLFSETELVKIFANSYYKDGKHKEKIDKDDIQKAMQGLRSKAGSGANPHIDLDALEDLREYITGSFGGFTRAAALEDVYWQEAIKLAPKLSLEDRAQLYGLIWDSIPEFTEMFIELARDLDKLGHPEEAFCELAALTPREASIIDVETLGRTDFSKFGVGNTIKMMGRDGKVAEISRKNATAIIAELALVMAEKPAEYFEHTDLLDFPGYKGRLECTDIRAYMQEGKEDSKVEQFFRRGKVDYLFQRYNAENELTSLLLCMATTDQVEGLAGAVEEWIKTTHGTSPQDRQNAHTALFYILTKSDRYFEEKAGGMDSLWDNTIEGNFLAHFGGNRSQATRWVKEWQPGRPFNNMFLLRNVNVKAPSIIKYEPGTSRELSLNPDNEDSINKVRDVFLGSPLVKAHFANPEKAFSALLALNDGGMEYIKNSLEPVCEPGLKLGQLAQALAGVAQTLEARLGTYYNSGNQEEELRKKKAFFGNFGKLFKNPYFMERFPELLNNFKIVPDQLFYLRSEAEKQYEEYKDSFMKTLREEAEQASSEAAAAVDAGDDPFSVLDIFDEPAPQEPGKQDDSVIDRDENSFYAEKIIETWGSRARSLAESHKAQNYYQFTKPVLLGMLDEIDQAMARLGIQQRLEKKFSEMSRSGDGKREKEARKQAAYAIGTLNDFVSWLGKNPAEIPQSQRNVDFNGQNVTVFKDKPPVEDYPKLPETFVPFSRQWYKDWLAAFYGLIVDNVQFADGAKLDLEANSRLGSIIQTIREAKESV